jgi:ferredoxin
MTRLLTITVDHRRCVGNAQCLNLAPAVFRHNANLQSEVVNPAGDPAESILKAARCCPTSAIRVVEATTGEVLFP